jgi:hypothetical protein
VVRGTGVMAEVKVVERARERRPGPVDPSLARSVASPRRQPDDSSPQEASRERLEPLVAIGLGPHQEALHVRAQARLAPVVAGGRLGALGLAQARRLEQGAAAAASKSGWSRDGSA